jgi:hypothetical protein
MAATPEQRDELFRHAKAAVLYGVTDGGFDGPQGVTKDEALSMAADYFRSFDPDWEPEPAPETAECAQCGGPVATFAGGRPWCSKHAQGGTR